MEKLRRLPPAALARVEALVDGITTAPDKSKSRFGAFAGIVSPEDAEAMIKAAEECERIDRSAW